jgi:hypothetical protein
MRAGTLGSALRITAPNFAMRPASENYTARYLGRFRTFGGVHRRARRPRQRRLCQWCRSLRVCTRTTARTPRQSVSRRQWSARSTSLGSKIKRIRCRFRLSRLANRQKGRTRRHLRFSSSARSILHECPTSRSIWIDITKPETYSQSIQAVSTPKSGCFSKMRRTAPTRDALSSSTRGPSRTCRERSKGLRRRKRTAEPPNRPPRTESKARFIIPSQSVSSNQHSLSVHLASIASVGWNE